MSTNIPSLPLAHARGSRPGFRCSSELKHYEEALTAFIRPPNRADSVETLSNRRERVGGLKRYEEAAGRTRTAPLLSIPVLERHGTIAAAALAGLKRYKEALACYDKALALAPENSNTWNNYGATMLSLKQDEAALPYFRDSTAGSNPTDADSWSNPRARLLDAQTLSGRRRR